MQKIELLCTLGPASFRPNIIKRLSELGVSLFRINLSHTDVDDLPGLINSIRQHTDTPICLDTEGAQIRTGKFTDPPATLTVNDHVELRPDQSPGSAECIPLYPRNIFSKLVPGDLISIDFSAALLQVLSVGNEIATGRVLNGGKIGNNKAVSVNRYIELAPLTEKDQNAIAIGKQLAVEHFALSFANSGKDVDLIRTLAGPDAFIISKVESRLALKNLDQIIDLSDAILIDRGDLSREIAIETIPIVQRKIIKHASLRGQPVYVATNLLESMISSPGPTRAEANDVYSTLEQGASGLVLAAETAIGDNPIACAGMIKRLIAVFQADNSPNDLDQIEGYSMLNPPVGGTLIRQIANEDDRTEAEELAVLLVDEKILMDAQQIATGVYSPLNGFMNSETLQTVLEKNTLENNVSWTLPIVLQVNQEVSRKLSVGESVILKTSNNPARFILRISEMFQYEIKKLTKRWFGTDDSRHPGVNELEKTGNVFVAGEVLLLDQYVEKGDLLPLVPEEVRSIFSQKNWSRVVGFHTRNAPHRAHEYIMLEALKLSGGDGLLISPVIGPKKRGDLLAKPLLESYSALLGSAHFPGTKALLSPFQSYPRYAGPREAVFTALCRKNMGCSHFVVGRDHTGVGNFYSSDASQKLFDQLGDIGISPIMFPPIAYDAVDRLFKEEQLCTSPKAISGTEMRKCLSREENLPNWFISDEVQEVLLRHVRLSEPLTHN